MRHTLELLRTEALLANAWTRGVTILIALSALLAGFFLGRVSISHHAESNHAGPADHATLGHSGPWGELEWVPISIECPDELLPVRAFEAKVTHWILKDYTPEMFLRLLDDLGINGELRDEFRSAEVLHVSEAGIDLTPTPHLIFHLPPQARKDLYALLAGFPENGAALVFVLAKTVDQRFAGSGVSPATLERFRQLSCEYGRYLVFSDVASLFSTIPTYEERARFLKALTRQQTMLVRLRVTPDSDIAALTNYWGKAVWTKDIRPLLESLANVPGGTRVGLVNLLPPGPTARLYSFPLPSNPLNGPEVKRDCHWTAFNFFREPEDARYGSEGSSDFILRKLRDDHFPVASDPRYGDLVLFLTPAGQLIHSAVYLADNIVYTKNGDTSLHPWMLSTVQDLIDQYSFQVPPDQALKVQYYRNKYY